MSSGTLQEAKSMRDKRASARTRTKHGKRVRGSDAASRGYTRPQVRLAKEHRLVRVEQCQAARTSSRRLAPRGVGGRGEAAKKVASRKLKLTRASIACLNRLLCPACEKKRCSRSRLRTNRAPRSRARGRFVRRKRFMSSCVHYSRRVGAGRIEMRDVGSGQTSERAGSSPLVFCNRADVDVLSERTRLLPLRRLPNAPNISLCASIDVGSLCLVGQ